MEVVEDVSSVNEVLNYIVENKDFYFLNCAKNIPLIPPFVSWGFVKEDWNNLYLEV